MTAVLSNALCGVLNLLAQASGPATNPASAPASQPLEHTPAFFITLLSLGAVALVIWLVPTLARPSRLSLANTPGRPGNLSIVHVLIVLGLYFGGQGLGLLLAQTMGLAVSPEPSPHTRTLATTCAQVFAIAASVVVASSAFRGGVAGFGLSLRHWIFDCVRGVGGFFISFPLVMGVMAISSLVASRLSLPVQTHPFIEYFALFNLPWQAVLVASAVVLAPLSEEFFFRGLLQTLLRKHLRSPWLAIVLTAAVFAASHAQAELAAIPSLFVLALAFGYLYERTGRLIAPVLLHAVFNAVMLATSSAS